MSQLFSGKDRGLNHPHHITNAALLRGRWHRQKDKNLSPSAKNQSSEIRLSESSDKKPPECVMLGRDAMIYVSHNRRDKFNQVTSHQG